jgi:hypothetical protein
MFTHPQSQVKFQSKSQTFSIVEETEGKKQREKQRDGSLFSKITINDDLSKG